MVPKSQEGLFMRIFIALKSNEEFLENLLCPLLPLKEKYPHFRWVPRENLHITLAFLGELDDDLLPLVKEAAGAALGSGEIRVTGGKLFTLPPRRDANVLALGFDEGGKEISSLSEKIRESLKMRGIFPGGAEKNNFLPHITVARKGREPLRFMKDDSTISVQGVFNTVAVYQSELLPQGPRYTVLASYPSGGKVKDKS